MRELSDEQQCIYVTFMLELCAALLGICCGGFVYFELSSGCVGFRFLGIALIVTGGVLAFLLYIFRKVKHYEYDIRVAKFLWSSVPLLLVMFALGVFALAVSSEGGGESIPGRSYKVYNVESYSKWMQNKVKDNWENVYKKTIVKNKEIVCKFSDQFGVDSALKYGCCQPPEECKFKYRNSEVHLVKPSGNGNYSANDDCNRWDDDPNTLCFDCKSCKAGFLQDVTRHWFFIGLILVVIVGVKLLLGIPFICLKMRSIRDSSRHSYRPII